MNNIIKSVSLILSIIGIFTYPISFIPSNNCELFDIMTGEYSEKIICFNGEKSDVKTEGNFTFNDNETVSFSDELRIEFDNPSCDWFNYFGIDYISDSYVKGTIEYRTLKGVGSEDFFLEPSSDGSVFYSFIDNSLKKIKQTLLFQSHLSLSTQRQPTFPLTAFRYSTELFPKEKYSLKMTAISSESTCYGAELSATLKTKIQMWKRLTSTDLLKLIPMLQRDMEQKPLTPT